MFKMNVFQEKRIKRRKEFRVSSEENMEKIMHREVEKQRRQEMTSLYVSSRSSLYWVHPAGQSLSKVSIFWFFTYRSTSYNLLGYFELLFCLKDLLELWRSKYPKINLSFSVCRESVLRQISWTRRWIT